MAIDEEQIIRTKFEALRPVMDERLTRLWAGAEADALGDGGIAIVGRATGLSRTTIRPGRDELRAGATADEVVWVRRPGGGRPRIEVETPEILDVLDTLVDPVTRGDPESPLRWTSKSTRTLADELGAQGYTLSPQKVGQLLHARGYSLQATQKTIEGTSHPDRNEQFEYINDRVDAFHVQGDPVISVDTKKKELVGPYANGGREWQPQGAPERARVHDFIDDTLGKVIPYRGRVLREGSVTPPLAITVGRATTDPSLHTPPRQWTAASRTSSVSRSGGGLTLDNSWRTDVLTTARVHP